MIKNSLEFNDLILLRLRDLTNLLQARQGGNKITTNMKFQMCVHYSKQNKNKTICFTSQKR